MSKASPYIRQDDVYMRLHHTYCMYDGKPVFVNVNVGYTIGEVIIYPPGDLSATKAKVVNITDDKFKFVFPELGYFNYKNRAVYLVRRPDRNQRQGLDLATCTVIVHNQNDSGLPPSVSAILSSENFIPNLEGIYPSLQEALKLLKEDAQSVAISKRVAIGYIGRNLLGLFYDSRLIGTYNRKREVFSITEDRLPSLVLSRLTNLGISYE